MANNSVVVRPESGVVKRPICYFDLVDDDIKIQYRKNESQDVLGEATLEKVLIDLSGKCDGDAVKNSIIRITNKL